MGWYEDEQENMISSIKDLITLGHQVKSLNVQSEKLLQFFHYVTPMQTWLQQSKALIKDYYKKINLKQN